MEIILAQEAKSMEGGSFGCHRVRTFLHNAARRQRRRSAERVAHIKNGREAGRMLIRNDRKKSRRPRMDPKQHEKQYEK